MEKTKEEIEEAVNKIIDHIIENEEQSKFPSMTYEQGIREALEWVLGGDDPTVEY